MSVPSPDVVEVRDSENNSVRIRIEYPKLPPKCCNCGKFGHLMNRCPNPLMKRKPQPQVQEKEKVKVALAPPSVSISGSCAPVEPQGKEVEEGRKIDLVQTSGASQNTQSRARSRSRARARRRSLSQLPSHRFHSSGSDRDELVASEVSEGSKQIPLREMKMQDSGKKLEDKSGLSGKIEKSTFFDTQVEEHIWLLPKVARRAQKQREQRATWNASAGQLMKRKILSFPNRRGTSGRKQNL